MRLLVVVNPQAGSRPSGDELGEAVAALRAAGHEVELLEAHLPGYAGEVVRERGGAFDRVVACGGDGTVSEIAAALVTTRSRAALVIAPAGTGNDLARALGALAEAGEAIRAAADGEARRIDAGLADGVPFVNATSAGPWAELSASVPPERKATLGPLSYVAAGLTHLGSLRPFPGRLAGGGSRLEGDFLYVAVCNGPSVGGGSLVAPQAVVDDGELDAVVLPALPATELVGAVRALRGGQEHEALVRLRGAEFLLESDEEFALTRDGEPLRKKQVRFQVLPGALAVVLPDLRRDKGVDEAGVVP